MTGRALIAGGGIAGMAAALALARTGWRVHLAERAPEIAEAGAGLQMSPNAVRALDWLGVGDGLREIGFAPAAAVIRDGRSGRELWRMPLGAAAGLRWGAPYLQVHRGDLLALLAEAARQAGVEIETGVRVTGYSNRPADIRFDREGAGGAESRPLASLDGDVAIGADGMRSALRQQLNGAEAPDFTGMVAWRALVPAERIEPGLVAPDATVWAGSGRHLVSYFLRGGALVNVVAVEGRAEWSAEGWRHPGEPERLRGGFDGWHPEVTALLAAVEETHVWGLFTRPEQVRWTDGRMALAGDAAHPMLPFMAQGAAQALEDAVMLARCLGDGRADPALGLARYERTRWPRAARVQAKSRANGRLFHGRGPLGRLLQQGLLGAVARRAPDFAAGRLDWLYGHDVTR